MARKRRRYRRYPRRRRVYYVVYYPRRRRVYYPRRRRRVRKRAPVTIQIKNGRVVRKYVVKSVHGTKRAVGGLISMLRWHFGKRVRPPPSRVF